MATFNTELSRKGPGLLFRDILAEKDGQIAAVVSVIDEASPDILALQGIDWDYDDRAISALNKKFAEPYDFVLSLEPNTGRMTKLDLDGDERTGGPRDAQGYGRFFGAGGMALLSRHPIDRSNAVDMTSMLWVDLPGAGTPTHHDGSPFPSTEALAVQRLSSTGHWMVPINTQEGKLTVLMAHATPPVFDGPEDRNGKRNADEVALLAGLVEGTLGHPAAENPVVLADLNLDPFDGEGIRSAFDNLLAVGLRDPRPIGKGGEIADLQGGANLRHSGNPSYDTVDWSDDGPGNLRVDFVLPARSLVVLGSGVIWPGPDDPMAETVAQASRHRLVWVDIDFP